MSTITRRSVRRASPTGHNARNHFVMTGVNRASCLGHPGDGRVRRVLQTIVHKFDVPVYVFGHPTKKRTKGRICWGIATVSA